LWTLEPVIGGFCASAQVFRDGRGFPSSFLALWLDREKHRASVFCFFLPFFLFRFSLIHDLVILPCASLVTYSVSIFCFPCSRYTYLNMYRRASIPRSTCYIPHVTYLGAAVFFLPQNLLSQPPSLSRLPGIFTIFYTMLSTSFLPDICIYASFPLLCNLRKNKTTAF